jgi:hypothetical protein
MTAVQAALYLVAVVLLVLVAVGVVTRILLAYLAYACALLAFALPTIVAAFH